MRDCKNTQTSFYISLTAEAQRREDFEPVKTLFPFPRRGGSLRPSSRSPVEGEACAPATPLPQTGGAGGGSFPLTFGRARMKSKRCTGFDFARERRGLAASFRPKHMKDVSVRQPLRTLPRSIHNVCVDRLSRPLNVLWQCSINSNKLRASAPSRLCGENKTIARS